MTEDSKEKNDLAESSELVDLTASPRNASYS